MLEGIADAIESSEKEILAANDQDMQQAQANKTDSNLIQRLQLKPQKLKNLCAGIRAIARQEEPLRKVCHSWQSLPCFKTHCNALRQQFVISIYTYMTVSLIHLCVKPEKELRTFAALATYRLSLT